ncbi:hypothetical protein Fmac_025004 [Flemingia macrophylla]|uniref:Uncharacterized protein n=1 Tax=Flemingia macrophylla TaxID=520843 RepID=A0ABD1LR02_9FABA
MAREIHSGQLILGGDPEQLHLVQGPKQGAHGGTDPADDYQNLNDVGRQQLPASTHEQPVRPVTVPNTINLIHVLLLRKQRREDNPPRAAPSVQLRRLQRIVEPHLLRQPVARDQHNGGHKPAHDGRPRLHHRAPGRDGGEPPQQAVADVGHVPVPGQDAFPKESGQGGG